MICKAILLLVGLHLSFAAGAYDLDAYSFREPADSPRNREAMSHANDEMNKQKAESDRFIEERRPIVINDGRSMEVLIPQGYGMYQRFGTSR
jgi:hypothetical protein